MGWVVFFSPFCQALLGQIDGKLVELADQVGKMVEHHRSKSTLTTITGNAIMSRCMNSQEESPLYSGNDLDDWLNRIAICVAITSVSRYCIRLHIKFQPIFGYTLIFENNYRVTIQLVTNLPFTSKKKFCFALARPTRPGQKETYVLNSTGGSLQAEWSPCYSIGFVVSRLC